MRSLLSWPSKLFLFGLSTLVIASWTPPKEYAITASADGHFLTANGDPFFWQADTAWFLFQRLNYTETELYLSDRASKGFNIIMAVGFVMDGISVENRYGDLMFIDNDVLQPNPAYWDYVDTITELAWGKGIRIGIVPAWGQYIHGSTNVGSYINETTAYQFGEFIGSRYPYQPKILVADTNPLWANETAVKDDYLRGGVNGPYNYTDWSPIYDDLAEGITNGERSSTGNKNWNPLMTIHPTNVWFDAGPAALAANFFGNRTWLTLNACQSGHTDFPPDVPLSWWNARRGYEPVGMMYATGETTPGTKRPAIDNEGHYEHRYDDGTKGVDLFYWNASDVRKGSWQSVFSGAAGVTYGENNVWQFYNPAYNTQDGSGPASPWYVDIHLPGSVQMQYISKAITDRGKSTYYQRIPAQNIILGDTGTDETYIAACRDSGGTWIMVYTPTDEPFTINIDSLKTKKITSNWYDPTSGTYTAFTLPTSESTIEFTPPTSINHTDWTLVLEAE